VESYRRLTGTPNHNFNAYARILYEYVYACPNCRVVHSSLKTRDIEIHMLLRFANIEIFHIFKES